MNKNKLLMFFIINGLFNLAANYAHPITPTVIKNLQLGDYMFGVAFGAMMGLNFLFSPFWGKLNEQINSKTTMLICSICKNVFRRFYRRFLCKFFNLCR